MVSNKYGGVTISLSSGIMWAIAIVFGIMKVGGVEPFVNWSWWLVTAPIWFGPALVLVIAGIFMVVFIVLDVIRMAFSGFPFR